MARVPCIESPCPLSGAEAQAIQGHCQHCNHHVYNLDGLNDNERQALLRNATGKICVRYSMAVPMALALGLSMGAAPPSFAAETHKTISSVTLPVNPNNASVNTLPQSKVPDKSAARNDSNLENALLKPIAKQDELQPAKELDMVVLMGGIRRAEDAEWVDDSDLPTLPEIQG